MSFDQDEPKMPNPTVIKYGGSLLEDPEHRERFLKDIAMLSRTESVALVHGGGKEITKALETSGIPTRFVQGRRFTDEATMIVVEKVLSDINERLVIRLNELGAKAAGFSGRFQSLMVARAIPDLGRVGQPQVMSETVLQRILSTTPLPVFYSVAADSHDIPLNLNADDFALALAVACRARRLVFLTDSGGILDQGGRPLSVITGTEVETLVTKGVITGGMMVKARACAEALKRGVGRVDICKGIGNLLSKNAQVEGTSFMQDHQRLN